MRSFALLSLCAVVGCATVKKSVTNETHAQLSSKGYVTLPQLADDLDLDYQGEERAGYIELSAPPDHVMFVRDSRQALVNGSEISMGDPCIRRGEQFVLTSADADLVSQRLAALRTSRRPSTRVGPTAAHRPEVPRANGLPVSLRPDAGFPERGWRYIIVHHSATAGGAAKSLDLIHRRNGWDGLGYHFVVGNGTDSADGTIEVGFRWRQQRVGAHARKDANDDNFWNRQAIGICLVGDFMKRGPSGVQLDALVRLIRNLRAEYGIPADHVLPHSSVVNTHCPGAEFPWNDLMARIR